MYVYVLGKTSSFPSMNVLIFIGVDIPDIPDTTVNTTTHAARRCGRVEIHVAPADATRGSRLMVSWKIF